MIRDVTKRNYSERELNNKKKLFTINKRIFLLIKQI